MKVCVEVGARARARAMANVTARARAMVAVTVMAELRSMNAGVQVWSNVWSNAEGCNVAPPLSVCVCECV